MPRQTRVTLLFMLMSALYWAAVWLYIQTEAARLRAAGAHDLALAMHELEVVFPATWAWVIGAAVLHVVAVVVTTRRGDAEARRGTAWSAGLHLIYMLATGVLRW